jgi:hypothetical protein
VDLGSLRELIMLERYIRLEYARDRWDAFLRLLVSAPGVVVGV